MKTSTLIKAKLLLVTATLLLPVSGYSAGAASQFLIKGEGVVSYVIDGDTMNIVPNNPDHWDALKSKAEEAQARYQRDLNIERNFDRARGTFRTRIGSINTAESVHRNKSLNTAAGKDASDYARTLISRKPVTFVCWDIGYYGRPICSVGTQNFDFGLIMIESGYSKYITKYNKHPFWHDQYQNADRNSR